MSKRRSDAFFGMHFDFHAGIGQTGIGENCNGALISRMLDEVKPDYVQCDTKGHAGATSYPTKVGYPAPEIKADILQMWRDITARHDVALFAHYSGVWDNNALIHNPDWAAADENGNLSKEKTSVFGPYADELLIKQLLELACDYELDGIWVDGECWAVTIDYSHWARDAYLALYNEEPPKSGEKTYEAYVKFCRDGFKNYLTHYIREVHKTAPDFQITSNWMYTSFVPEEPVIPIDFISGDYSPNDSVNTARFEGRCIANQGKPWDLMAWGFSTGNGFRCVKEYEQLCQEAAAVIALGGGFQFYNTQRVGTVQEWAIPMWAELAKFCRRREAVCHKAKAVPQVGIVYSAKAHYKGRSELFFNHGTYINEVKNTLLCVLDSGIPAEILMTHHILSNDNLNAYATLIVTDLDTIEPELRAKLLDYAQRGGNLVITGYHSTLLFLPYLDIEIIDGNENEAPIYLVSNGKMAPVASPYRVVATSQAQPAGAFYRNDDTLGQKYTAASITNYGGGKIAGIYFNVGAYAKAKTAVMRNFIKDFLCGLCPPSVRMNALGGVEIALMQKSGKLCVNLLNLGGYHSDASYKSFDRVPPVRDIGLEIDYPSEPIHVTLEPDGTDLAFVYENGVIKITVPELHIHSVVTVE